ncbi:hypothetical protein PILCRDRAFT_2102 [Piloderma croceum F 1598]|uniref:Uncharacterized protein n=1 Tax=Piloderma croceum (strain F 1598) TaxID=765440 RepID=A0A0C3G0S2_PILCF|nr:hypothetical protein PILCRDRAFT_2102 [Piloderma croceum F 1598]
MNLLPRWPNLNHLSNVLNVAFSDGRKFEDILKGILFVTHNVLNDNATDFLLLKCLRSKAVLSMYIGLKVQTEDTIAAGQDEEYLKKTGMPIDYPKLHWHKHAFEDILAKGPTRHYSTKPNEKCHGPLRESYLWHTNKHDVGKQILGDNHHHLMVKYVHQCITDLDEYHQEKDIDAEDDHEPDIDKKTR